MNIGILAVQGAFIEHKNILNKLGIDSFEIRQKQDIIKSMDGIILPGGESTAMGKLLHDLELFEPIKQLINNGLPVFGTCAGLLLLAHKISNDDRIYFASMPIIARRNAYGRQLGSFNINAQFDLIGEIPMVFIRAPYIESVYNGAEALAKVDGKIVAAKYKNQLVTAFHPELTDNTAVHEYFIDMINKAV